ncbi:DUF6625 family protein [Limosilactobacillus reuteri]|uniref:DUF6625 family protein n=1 Tax=Limosilactobacillus reuteri TaxID=1598 RepID=UPI00128D6EF3|nr:DUF6625 family protein [Limosilactobacillus reuteri]MQB97567.1 hypothetical protein [Limosilactobacillus reuteri]
MKKCLFIVPYFGKLPNTFPMFLKSCYKNQDFNWLIITDDTTDYDYPENVTRIQMNFNDIVDLFEKKLGMKIVLDTPMKLCDFKPIFGMAFEEYLSDYKFWGNCDLDIVLGQLNNFITNEMLETYDKIFELGHLILYRNLKEVNYLFKQKINGIYWYKKVFKTDKICGFDETWENDQNINTIFLNNGKKVFRKSFALDISTIPTKFNEIKYNPQKMLFKLEEEPQSKFLCVWERGKIRRYFLNQDENIEFKEYLYIHYQDRKMTLDPLFYNSYKIKIIPEYIGPLEVDKLTPQNFNKVKKFKPNISTIKHYIHYFLNKKVYYG